jgi:hypothetical protein
MFSIPSTVIVTRETQKIKLAQRCAQRCWRRPDPSTSEKSTLIDERMPVTRMISGTLQIALIRGRVFDPMKLFILAKLFRRVDWSTS